MDVVIEILERVSANPTNEGQTHSLMARAAAEIGRLRGVYEPAGVVDPWTGVWVADGICSIPDATHDGAGRLVPSEQATHALTIQGLVREVPRVRREKSPARVTYAPPSDPVVDPVVA